MKTIDKLTPEMLRKAADHIEATPQGERKQWVWSAFSLKGIP